MHGVMNQLKWVNCFLHYPCLQSRRLRQDTCGWLPHTHTHTHTCEQINIRPHYISHALELRMVKGRLCLVLVILVGLSHAGDANDALLTWLKEQGANTASITIKTKVKHICCAFHVNFH